MSFNEKREVRAADQCLSRMAEMLSNWYHANHRDLPWRHTKDPYAIWISEIMAQQTRISALLPYYERFMIRFPDIRSLAKASMDDVLLVWAGLGYYKRAHNLHMSAKRMVEEYAGIFPRDVSVLQSFPGIGEYTAGAIASICYGLPTAAVDGNVKRVYARLLAVDDEVNSKNMLTKSKQFVASLMPYAEPSVLTQSLMELGALVCSPKRPKCQVCPFEKDCKAHDTGQEETWPVKLKKPTQKTKYWTVLVIINSTGDILLRKRSETLLQGLYQYVLCDGKLSDNEVMSTLETSGFTVNSMKPLGKSRHLFTHLIWEMVGYVCYVDHAEEHSLCPEYSYYSRAQWEGLAFPTALAYYNRQISQFLE